MITKTLTRDQIMDTISNVKNGQIVRVTYQSEVPLKATFKDLEMKIYKFTETSVRTGVNYHNIENVIKRKAEQKGEPLRKKTNNYEWLIKNKVKYNKNTGKEYIVFAPLKKGDHTKVIYALCFESQIIMLSESSFKHVYSDSVIPSYWTPSKTGEDIKTVSFENVIRIGNVGSKINFNYFK